MRNKIDQTAVLLLFAAIIVFFFLTARLACAQGGGFLWSERSSSQPSGTYSALWNATGSTIADGTVVMSDTTSATVQPQIPLGKGFTTYVPGTTAITLFNNVRRIVGVLVGDTPGYSQGRVMVYGWHNNVLMDATAITGMTFLRPSLTTSGALGSYAATDSVNNVKPIVGQFQRYATTTTLRGYCKIDFRSVIAGSN